MRIVCSIDKGRDDASPGRLKTHIMQLSSKHGVELLISADRYQTWRAVQAACRAGVSCYEEYVRLTGVNCSFDCVVLEDLNLGAHGQLTEAGKVYGKHQELASLLSSPALRVREQGLSQSLGVSYTLQISQVPKLYVQIHRAASMRQGEFEFRYYLGNEQGIKAIYDFFSNYPRLLPKDVKLGLYLYDDRAKHQYGDFIEGVGITDTNYSEVVKLAIFRPKIKDPVLAIDAPKEVILAALMRCLKGPQQYPALQLFMPIEKISVPLVRQYRTDCEYIFQRIDKHCGGKYEDVLYYIVLGYYLKRGDFAHSVLGWVLYLIFVNCMPSRIRVAQLEALIKADDSKIKSHGADSCDADKWKLLVDLKIKLRKESKESSYLGAMLDDAFSRPIPASARQYLQSANALPKGLARGCQ